MFKPKVKIILVFLVFAVIVAGGAVYFLGNHYVAPILMYHSVNPVENPYIKRLIVHPDSFEMQMAFFKRHNYNVVPLTALVEMIARKQAIPARTVAITFDDGYKDNYRYAFPVLKKYNLPATIFVIIDEIGRSDRLSWQEIKEMLASGLISIGSHALGPEPLVKIQPESELRKQIFVSKEILEQRLATEVKLFSYPEGMFNDRIRKLVIDAGYVGAVATSPGKQFSPDDVFALKRLRISSTSDNLAVFWFESSGYYTFFKERRKK